MVSIILVSIGRCGKNISILGQAGLLAMLKQGLVQKISIEYVTYSCEGNMIKGILSIIENYRKINNVNFI